MKARRKAVYNFPVVIEKDESGYYVGTVPSLRSCYTQAKTLSELYKRLQEAVALCLAVKQPTNLVGMLAGSVRIPSTLRGLSTEQLIYNGKKLHFTNQ